MSMANLTAAVEAINALKDTFLAKVNQINAAVAAAGAGYAALATDLKATVADVMDVTISYDPAAPDALLQDGGVFRTWAELRTFVLARPRGAQINVVLPVASVLNVTQTLGIVDSFYNVNFKSAIANTPNRPKLLFVCTASATHNSWPWLNCGDGGSIKLIDTDVELTAKANAALPNSTSNAAFNVTFGSNGFLTFIQSKLKAPADTNIIQLSNSGIARVVMRTVEIDGPTIGLYRYAGQGVAILSTSVVTLLNGALLHSADFTLGSNLMRN